MSTQAKSAVWDYFGVTNPGDDVATCELCNSKIRRGSAGSRNKSFSTKALWSHLKSKHKEENALAQEKQEKQKDAQCKKRKLEEEKKQVYVITEEEKSAGASTSRQLTVQETLTRKQKWDKNNPEQREGENLLVHWLCDSVKSYTTVENKRFKKFIGHLSSRFNIPSEKVIRTKLVPELSNKVQYKVLKSLKLQGVKSQNSYNITTDLWTSPSRDSFMSITAHWINRHYQRKMAVLRCIRYNKSHTGEHIAEALKQIFNDWELQNVNALVTDNATNIVSAASIGGYKRIGCFCHILHLIVIHSVLEQSGVKMMLTR